MTLRLERNEKQLFVAEWNSLEYPALDTVENTWNLQMVSDTYHLMVLFAVP